MDFSELKKLKSGTDIRGFASGENITLTDEAVRLFVKAFCAELMASGIEKPRIALGHDPRISSLHIAELAANAALSCGADVVYTGLSSTPSMFILLKESDFGCDASLMITASHLPANRNGLKFFTREGGYSSKDIDKLIETAAKGIFPNGRGEYCERSFMDEYSRILVKKVESECGKTPLKGKKIIVDAGNGAGGFFTDKVLKPLGADTEGSLYLEPDGNFPNHIPNPEDKGAIDCLSSAVLKNGADLGIIFDTDVDRAACVDKDGDEINRNKLIALLSAIILPARGGVVVTDSVTSAHLTEFIKNCGGEHLRFKRGYKNVIDKCAELNKNGVYSPLAIETSGHAAFPENYYLDDGAYLITKVLACMAAQSKNGKTLSDLIAGLKSPAEESEIRIGFSKSSTDFASEGNAVIDVLKNEAEKRADMRLADDNYEGVRIFFDNGLALVRMSVHDPVMPINIESDEKGGCGEIAKKLYDVLTRFGFLDLENLEKYISRQGE